MTATPADLLEEARHLDRSGQKSQALEAFERYLECRPGDAGGWADFGGLLMDTGQWAAAGEACEKALRIEAGHYTALVHSAGVLSHEGRLDEAEQRLLQAVSLDPVRSGARLTLADCMVLKGHLQEARSLLEGVLTQHPESLPALDRLSTIYVLHEDWPALRRDLERQISRFAGVEADYRRSHLNLLFGDMEAGWPLFEARLELPGRTPSGRFSAKPAWKGEPFPDKTLLLHWEQGFGDTLMFIRYASRAKALGGTVLVEVQPPLADLISTCPGVDGVILPSDPPPSFDLHLPLLSLPAVFQTDLATLPADIPYLDIPERVPNREPIREALAASVGRFRVGLAWEGNPRHQRDSKRSVPPDRLAALADFPGVAWHSFQMDSEVLPPLPGITSLAPFLSTFSDTAYALSGMDLVITVDTALAHLSGALGIPTWLLVSFIPDWRWMVGRDDSPWYPTLRIFRQTRPGDWDSVLQKMASLVTTA